MRIDDVKFRKNYKGKWKLMYGDLDDYEPEDLAEYNEEIPKDSWNAEMWLAIADNLIEDANYHSLGDLPHIFIENLRNSGIGYDEITKYMKIFTMSLYDSI